MSPDIVISENVSVSRHGGVALRKLDDGPWGNGCSCVGFLERDFPLREEFVALFARQLNVSAAILDEDLRRAFWVQNHEFTNDAWCGGCGPLADEPNVITYDRFLEVVDEQERLAATARAKKAHTAIRRAEFSRVRSDKVLALLDAGIPYECNHPGCTKRERLTIDHIRPLSRGGTDDIRNLQFMCQPHNSQKGASYE